MHKMTLNLKQFINPQQLQALRELCTGEEKQHFIDIVRSLKKQIADMPKSYESDGKGDEAPVTLHYFSGGSDWYIIERDMETEQRQAFGFAIINGMKDCAELGYISIPELLENNIELDLYFEPCTLEEIKQYHNIS